MQNNLKSIKWLSKEDQIQKNIILNKNSNNIIPETLRCVEPEEIYDENQKKFINFDEKYKSKFNACENIVSNLNFNKESIEIIKSELVDISKLINEERESLKVLNKNTMDKQENDSKFLKNIIENFHNNLKAELNINKNENYHLIREFQQLNREKIQLQQQITFSMKRIEDLEKEVGIKKIKIK